MITVDVKYRYPSRGAKTPRSFRLSEKTILINQVLDQWFGIDHRYFKILAEDRAIYILRHDMIANAWEVIFYDNTNELL